MTASAPTEPGEWISARHLRHVLARGEALGVDMEPILAAGNLTRAGLADPDAAVPMTAVEALLDAWIATGGDPLPGLRLAVSVQPPTFGALGLVFQSCATLADALQTVIRFNGLLSSFGETRLEFAPGAVRVCWRGAAGGEQFRRQAAEYVLGVFVTVARLLLDIARREGPALALTQQALGDLLGLSRVTIGQAMGELATLGLVNSGYRQIKVLDMAGLRAMAVQTR